MGSGSSSSCELCPCFDQQLQMTHRERRNPEKHRVTWKTPHMQRVAEPLGRPRLGASTMVTAILRYGG